jgi:hypothetical protein
MGKGMGVRCPGVGYEKGHWTKVLGKIQIWVSRKEPCGEGLRNYSRGPQRV